ncbi:MAG: hemin-degrading factor [Spirochaetaceae bacterium]
MTVSSTTDGRSLIEQWDTLAEETPSIRVRDAAHRLGVSELELLYAVAEAPENNRGIAVTVLGGDPAAHFSALSGFGRLMALTRNDAVVSETYGHFGEISVSGKRAMVHHDGIDLRVDFHHWHHAVAVETHRGQRCLRSLQFFDCDGQAVHKAYLTDDSVVDLYETYVRTHQVAANAQDLQVRPADPPVDNRGGSDVDVEELRRRWSALTDTHQFVALLSQLKVQRIAALRAVGPEFAQRARPGAWKDLLEYVRENGLPVMIFVRSPGCTQIYSGPVRKLMTSGDYFNVFDPEFHLHMREDELAESWVVRKPTAHGTVTSLEVYSPDGTLALQFFGVREDTKNQSQAWHECIEQFVAE